MARKPSRWGYALAILILICGNLVSLSFALKWVRLFGVSFHRVIAPGEHAIELKRKGTYTVFYEYQSTIGGKMYVSEPRPIPDLEYSVLDEDGSQLALVPHLGNSTYRLSDGSSGRSLFKFKTTDPGRFVLKATYADGKQTPEVVLALAEGFTRRLFHLVGVWLIVNFVTIPSAGFVAFRTFKKRRRFAKAQQAYS